MRASRIAALYPVLELGEVEQAFDLERELQPDLALVA
jgi:hypothetical protein